jgi:hypothetical protein
MEKVKVSSLRPSPKNPRLIKNDKFKKLVRSIQEFPDMLKLRPIIVDEDSVVLGGNMRLKACIEAKVKEVYIERLTKKSVEASNKKYGTSYTYQERCDEFMIKDNSGFGDWDWDILANEWDTDLLGDWGLDLWKAEEDTEDEGYVADPNFDDEGVGYKSQFGVIVECDNEKDQEKVYRGLTEQGYKCKIVVT